MEVNDAAEMLEEKSVSKDMLELEGVTDLGELKESLKLEELAVVASISELERYEN